jgi:hypothetical protein
LETGSIFNRLNEFNGPSPLERVTKAGSNVNAPISVVFAPNINTSGASQSGTPAERSIREQLMDVFPDFERLIMSSLKKMRYREELLSND